MASDVPFERMPHTDKVWLRERKKRIKQLMQSLYTDAKNERILDAAMGQWSLIKDLFPQLYVVGIDHDFPSTPPDEFYKVDLKESLPFKKSEFTFVFAGEIIEHLGSQQALNLLKEISRVLQPQGHLLLTTPNGSRNILKNTLRRSRVAAHEKEFSVREIAQLFRKTGFRVVHSEGIQPLFIPWGVTTAFSSLKLPVALSSQLIFLCQTS